MAFTTVSLSLSLSFARFVALFFYISARVCVCVYREKSKKGMRDNKIKKMKENDGDRGEKGSTTCRCSDSTTSFTTNENSFPFPTEFLSHSQQKRWMEEGGGGFK